MNKYRYTVTYFARPNTTNLTYRPNQRVLKYQVQTAVVVTVVATSIEQALRFGAEVDAVQELDVCKVIADLES